MNVRILTSLIILAGTTLYVSAQSVSPQDDFRNFQQRIHSDFNSFRNNILDDYSHFLNNSWASYNAFKGQKRDNKPKPTIQPVFTPPATPEQTPIPSVPTPLSPTNPVPVVSPQPQQPHPVTLPQPSSPELSDTSRFPFYASTLFISAPQINIARHLSSPEDYANQWSSLRNNPAATSLINAARDMQTRYGLNGYLTYRALVSWAKTIFPDASSASRASLVHYILSKLGYDVRIATLSDGKPAILIPSKQQLFDISYVNLNSRRYYFFTPDDDCPRNLGAVSFKTCNLPSEAKLGDMMDFRLNGLSLPEDNRHFHLSYGDLTLDGQVNKNALDALYRYPHMQIADYADSFIDGKLRKSLVTQLKSQLQGKSLYDALSTLLSFTQHVFTYATDSDAHGFEKPYFLEEILSLPTSDCEDRAIFFSYIVTNVLGLESQLINWPGHEATAVASFPGLDGDGYIYNDRKYIICDPTYTDAAPGTCMPAYSALSPTIHLTLRP